MQNAECKAKRQKPFYRKECKEDKEPEARGTLIHADKTLITDTANIETAVCSCELAGYVVVMRIALAKDVEEFLKEQVRAGLAADPVSWLITFSGAFATSSASRSEPRRSFKPGSRRNLLKWSRKTGIKSGGVPRVNSPRPCGPAHRP